MTLFLYRGVAREARGICGGGARPMRLWGAWPGGKALPSPRYPPSARSQWLLDLPVAWRLLRTDRAGEPGSPATAGATRGEDVSFVRLPLFPLAWRDQPQGLAFAGSANTSGPGHAVSWR
ncbi:hypothetical protein HVPorG_04234 [Roseomonas mucosa]|nr:hypothetical protein HVPorG_04234 [Roseomonas mucosa]